MLAKINPTLEQPEVPAHVAYANTQLFATQEAATTWLRNEQVAYGARADATNDKSAERVLLITSEAYGRALKEVKAAGEDAMFEAPVDLRALVDKHAAAITEERAPKAVLGDDDPDQTPDEEA
jgi:hypothetical protein